ncbi:OadG family protein [Arcobacter sp. FWKO B]|uniref:OadG family protein n=1 Tax=Arcobacter sp. FWKO B TaxID=2593672 RepID=UPI0018A67947|nr:OadG family protein [Arcobacter sp. FWKO B]QOG13017.1 hypothetical protein FWKOB_10100 [Arcobacter sp. FWKO B]
MENINLVYEAIKFMFLGMGVVFCFLIMLVYVLKIQAFVIQKYFSSDSLSNTNVKGKI